MVTREKNGDGEIRGKAIEARRGEAARASAAVARVGRAPDCAARARAWIRRGEGVERAQLRVRVPRGANSDVPRGAAVRATKKKLSSSRSVHSCTRTHSSPRRVLIVIFRGAHRGRRARVTERDDAPAARGANIRPSRRVRTRPRAPGAPSLRRRPPRRLRTRAESARTKRIHESLPSPRLYVRHPILTPPRRSHASQESFANARRAGMAPDTLLVLQVRLSSRPSTRRTHRARLASRVRPTNPSSRRTSRDVSLTPRPSFAALAGVHHGLYSR